MLIEHTFVEHLFTPLLRYDAPRYVADLSEVEHSFEVLTRTNDSRINPRKGLTGTADSCTLLLVGGTPPSPTTRSNVSLIIIAGLPLFFFFLLRGIR